MCFLFTMSVCFVHSIIQDSKNYSAFIFLIFIFAYKFVVLQKTVPSQLFSGAIPWRVTSRELSLEWVNLKDTNLPFGSVSTSHAFKTQMKQKKHAFLLYDSPGEKDGTQSTISCMVYLIMVDMTFSLNSDDFFWFRQSSGARSCFRGSLVASTQSYIMF